jgi:diguanylate cyclase
LAALQSLDLTVSYDTEGQNPTDPAAQREGRLGASVHTKEREQALAKTALALLTECDVVPTPENFELFYIYASGENSGLSRVMGDTIAAGKPFTPQLIGELRTRCLPGGREMQAVENVGAGMNAALNTVLAKIEAAGKDATEYGRTLSAAHGELSGSQSPEDIRELVTALKSATHAMEDRTKTLEHELQRSSNEVTMLKTQLHEVRRESLTDPLTQIANRKAFDYEIQNAISDSEETAEPLSLFMCDIDKFKNFNDTWGHQTGDQVLRLVGHCLQENVKGRDTACRYGGEEFAVILRHTALNDAVKLAEQIRANVESKKLVKKSTGDILGTITISIGVAQLGEGENMNDLIQRADACLYRAKNSGRNCVIGETDPRFAASATHAA